LHVEFRGRVTDEALADELRAAVALIFPSTWREGAPAVYAEALSAGLPVIAVRGNAVAEFVDQDRTGVVVEELTELTIDSAVAEITLRAESLFTTCRNIYLRDYTRESWMSRLNQIYIDAVAKRRSRSKT
jgi:glycosyltransferase involved in cell wall biosynthesis